MKVVISLVALLLPTIASAQTLHCAQLHYQTTQQLSDGVDRTDRYNERWCYDDQNIWIERIVPARSVREQSAPDKSTEAHVDLTTVARWYRRNANNVEVTLLDRSRQLRIPLSQNEWELIGFNGDFSALKNMHSTRAKDPLKHLDFRLTISEEPSPAQAPWADKSHWTSREYSDFSD